MADYQTMARTDYVGREITLHGRQAVPFDPSTTHKSDYVAHPFEPRPAHGPAQYAGGSLPFDGQTTYNAHYLQHQMPDRHVHQPHQFQPSPAPFDGQTTYKNAYIPHQMERGPLATGPTRERVNLPFDGTTSYRSDYTKHQMPERPVAAGGPYIPSHVPFDGSTTYNGDFVPHAMEPRPQATGTGTLRQSLPFDGTTTYGEYFRPYPVQPHALGGPRAGEFKPSGAKFEGMSESMDKYRAWAIDPANRQGHGPPAMRPSLPFDGTTTNREMFKGWQLPPRRPALGVQMMGDVAYVLVPPNAPLPAVGRQVFTTVHEGQTEIRVLVLEGDFSQASRCNVLGHLDMTGIPPGPKGSAKIEVAYHIDQNGVLNVTASDLNTHRQEQWLRDGLLVAHVNAGP